MSDITSIHDTFIRAILADKNIALDYFKTCLPSFVQHKLDFSSLTQLPDTYVSEELKKTVSDIVYSCRMKDRKEEVKIALLIEHKSAPYKYTPIQIGGYIFSGLLRQIANKEKLSLIIPVLLYHGRKKWKYRTMADIFADLDPELRLYVPLYEFIFHNLGEIPDEEIEKLNNKFLAASIMALKYSQLETELKKLIPRIIALFRESRGIVPNLQSNLLVYTFIRSNLREWQVIALINELPLTIKNTVMDNLNYFEERGKKIGRKEGRQERAEEVVRNMIRKGYSDTDICEVLEVTAAYIARIRKDMAA